MIKNISALNFRSFKNINADLAPITLFVGPNNSGKSSAISIIRLLAQTAESNDPNVRLLLDGPLGDFGTYKDVVYGNVPRRHLEIDFTFIAGESVLKTSDEIKFQLHYKYRSALKETILKKISCYGDGQHQLTAEYIEDSERFLIRKLDNILNPPSSSFHGLDVRNFLPRPIISTAGYEGENSLSKSVLSTSRIIGRNSNAASRIFRSVEFVGAMRVPPTRTHLYTGERRQKVGANGEHAITMLAMDSMRRGKKNRGIRQGVVKWLISAGIASDIKIISLSDRYFEVHVQHPITREYANFADVGYGNSQVIPVLVGGLNAASGSTFIVEEPEIHLHPKAQAELGDFFLELHNRGVQSIIETHSEHMIVRLQRHIATGKLKASDLYIYYVNPTERGKELIRLELNDKGIFKEDWPGGFFPERLKEARDLAAARSVTPSTPITLMTQSKIYQSRERETK